MIFNPSFEPNKNNYENYIKKNNLKIQNDELKY